MGYLRFTPGPSLQRTTFYSWETGLTRFSSERLGYTLDGRGYTGIAYVGVTPLSQGAFTRPQISMYNILFGPIYRFYLQPKYSIAGRAMGGWAYGNFTGDTNAGSRPPRQLPPLSHWQFLRRERQRHRRIQSHHRASALQTRAGVFRHRFGLDSCKAAFGFTGRNCPTASASSKTGNATNICIAGSRPAVGGGSPTPAMCIAVRICTHLPACRLTACAPLHPL